MMTSKYLEQFKKVDGKPYFKVVGGRVVVELLPKEELKTSAGLIISGTSDYRSATEENRAMLAVVLAVGEGYFDKEGNLIDIPVKPGYVIQIPAFAGNRFTQFPGLVAYSDNDIALVSSEVINMFWPSIEAYEEYKAALNA